MSSGIQKYGRMMYEVSDEQFLCILHGIGIVKYRFAVYDSHLLFLCGSGRRLHCYKKIHFLHLRVVCNILGEFQLNHVELGIGIAGEHAGA